MIKKSLFLLAAIFCSSLFSARALDVGFYYYLSNEFTGPGKVMDVVNDGKNTQIVLAQKGDFSGQLWKITPVGEGFVRLTTQWRGDEYSLDIVNDGENNKLILAKTGNFEGQLWKFTPAGNGYNRLSTRWRGEKFSLDVLNDNGSKSTSLILAPTENVSGQNWKVSKSPVPIK